ncbi:MAG: ArsR family transcriptional regulator [Thermoproteaceae archaeon]|nr:ArsR family transcriptional regulator [Thermoproteaceae archaeon]
MPKRQTERVYERKRLVVEYLRKYGELTTGKLIELTGLSHSQVFYVLKILEHENIVREIKRGKIAYWKLAELQKTETA